jgi:hypothetical protein
LNSISNPLTPEESEQDTGMKPVFPGDLRTHRNSIHARASKPIATEANTLFHVSPHRRRPVFSKTTLRTVFQPNNSHSLPTFHAVNKSFSIK